MKIVNRGAFINAADIGDLQEALNKLPGNGGAVYLPAGEYEIDQTVVCSLKDKQHLYLYGDGRATVVRFTAGGGQALLDLRGVENSWWPDLKITIRDLTLVGNHDCGDAFHLMWPNDALIDSCFFYGFGGTAIRVTPNATNVTIRDCWMRDCKRALHADSLHHLTFHGNQTRSAKEGQIQDEHVYIGEHCREVRIVNNHLAYGHAQGIILDGTAQHVIANNTIEGFTEGIRAVDCRDITINANYIHCATGILMAGDNRGLIINANLFTDTYEGAVTVRDAGNSGGNIVTANVIRQSVYNDGQAGIDLGDAADCVVRANLLEDITNGPGIRANGEQDHAVTANVMTDCSQRAARDLCIKDVPPPAMDSPLRALFTYFMDLPNETSRVTLAAWDFNRILADALPDEAWTMNPWWTNDPDSQQAHAWLAAGWLVIIAKRIEGRIVFARLPRDRN